MSISIIDLPYLIRLVDQDIKALKATIDDPSTSDEERDDCGDLMIVALRTEANLRSQYEMEWRPDSNFLSYDELLQG